LKSGCFSDPLHIAYRSPEVFVGQDRMQTSNDSS
jgi:hypothetical protein